MTFTARSLAVALALVACAALSRAPASADPVAIGDVVRVGVTDLPASVARASGFIGGPFLMTNLSQGDATWVTFCVELDERVSFGSSYLVNGIGTMSRNTNRPLDARTAWLYEQFRWGTLSSYDLDPSSSTRFFDPLSGDDTRSLQFAIWLAQGYSYLGPPTFTLDHSGDALALSLLALAASRTQPGYIGSVRIVNLVTNDEFRLAKQDQLTLVPVPEPAVLLLIGSGLVGLAAMRRRQLRAGR